MKLPNGYGTVYKLSGNRRNPYVAGKVTGWETNKKTGRKKKIFKPIGYYPDKPTALQALANYNNSPYNLQKAQATFNEVYELWSKEAYSTGSRSKANNYKTAYKRCEPIYNKKMIDLRPPVLQKLLDDIPNPTYDKVTRVKKLLNQLYKFCIQNDFLRDNFAENLEVKISSTRDEKTPFSSNEIKFLWDNVNQNDYVKAILMLIYSGLRINELLDLKTEDVRLEQQIFYVRKSKTDSGIRIVPIADKVLPFWEEFIAKSKCEYAFTTVQGAHFTYTNFHKKYWTPLIEKLGLEHTIHETRHTCITQLIQNGADMTIVKHIVGHKSVMNLTERVYTHIENQKLIDTINMIP